MVILSTLIAVNIVMSIILFHTVTSKAKYVSQIAEECGIALPSVEIGDHPLLNNGKLDEGFASSQMTDEREEQDNPSYDESSLSPQEQERLERVKKFDERIKRIQEEIDEKEKYVAPKETEAMELHPNVKNLPHETQHNYNPYPDVEYAE